MFVLIDGAWMLQNAVNGVATTATHAVLEPGECVPIVTTDPTTGITSTKVVCSYPRPDCGCKKKPPGGGDCGCGGGRRRPDGGSQPSGQPKGGWE